MGKTLQVRQRPETKPRPVTKTEAPPGYAKKETLWLVGFVALIVGFVAGVAFSVYKQEGAPALAPMPQGQPRNDIAARIPVLVQQAAGHPDEPAHWIELGNAYYDTEQPEKAIEAYQKALALKPDNPDVWTDLGVMFRHSGQPEKAIEAFEKAIGLNDRHEIARFNKGVVLMHDLNDREGAIKAWEQLLAINPQAGAPGGQSLKAMVERLKEQAPR